MARRTICIGVRDYVMDRTAKSAGASGSDRAAALRLSFDESWAGTTKTVYFTDARGETSSGRTLGLLDLAGGLEDTYDVPIPASAMKWPGRATMTVRGVVLDEDGETETVLTTAAIDLKISDSRVPETVGELGTVDPTAAEQLQAEIDGLRALFLTSASQAQTSAAAAKASESAAKGSETAAKASQTAAKASEEAAKASGDTAQAAATDAAASAAKAKASEEAAAASETAAKASEDAAKSSQTKAQTSETTAKGSETAAKTSETNAAASAAAAKVSQTNAAASEAAAAASRTAAATSAANAQASAAQAVSIEEDAQQREAQRQTAEAGRQHAEGQRESAELGRQDAERQRESAETARNVWEEYAASKAYVPGNKVSFKGSSYVCTANTTGNAPTSAAYWLLIAKKGEDGSGAGDMLAATYDPQGKAQDVFAYADGRASAAQSAAKTYTDGQIAAIPTPDVSGQISAHDTSATAHSALFQAANDAAAQAQSAASAAQSGLAAHKADKSNPHGVTAAQVGALPLTGGTMTGVLDAAAGLKVGDSSDPGSSRLVISNEGGVGWKIATDGEDPNKSISFDGMTLLDLSVATPTTYYHPATKGYVDGKMPFAHTVTLSSSGWNSSTKQQTVACSGVVADETKQLIVASPASSSLTYYRKAWCRCVAQAANSLTFQCDTVPTQNLTVYVAIVPVTWS